jgi:hypothetical protein
MHDEEESGEPSVIGVAGIDKSRYNRDQKEEKVNSDDDNFSTTE